LLRALIHFSRTLAADAMMAVGHKGRAADYGRVLARSVCYECVEHLSHRLCIAAHDRCGCLDVPGGVKALPVKGEPRVAGELLEEGSLGPPVALAERVNRVDLS
jgi:hypothetical protein